MNKAFYISSLVLSVLFGIIVLYYIDLVTSARYSYDNWYSGSSYNSGSSETEEAGLISLFFFLFFITTFLLGLIKIKRITNKVFSIIGLSLTALFLLWDLVMLSSPSGISFDEVGIGFFFFVPMLITFSIIGIVQSIRYKRQGVSYQQKMESDLLDS
jgi:hypothetical protein